MTGPRVGRPLRRSEEMMRSALAASAMILSVVLAACVDDESGAPATTVTDSAGVEIVMSLRPVWETGGAWSVSERPTLEIGAALGDEAYELYAVRAAVRLPDGRIAVANGGTLQVRVYDANGRHLQDIGGPGDGPGEFRSLRSGLWLALGDSIVVYDGRLSRITVFDLAGRLGRTITLRPDGDARQAFGMRPFDDGHLLVEGVVLGERPREGLFDGGSRVYQRYSPEGVPLNRIGQMPHAPNWGYSVGGRTGYTAAPFRVTVPPGASDGTSVYIGSGGRSRIDVVDAEGRPTRVIRWHEAPIPVTQELRDAYRPARLEGAERDPERRPMIEASLDGVVFPEELPVYQRILVDGDQHLWVERYRPPWDQERRWWVFDPSGRWLGEPDVPPDLDLRDVDSDYVLGVRRDENDVERLQMYELRR